MTFTLTAVVKSNECRFSRPLSIGLLFSGLCRGRLDCWVADVSIAMLLSSSELVNKLIYLQAPKKIAAWLLKRQLPSNPDDRGTTRKTITLLKVTAAKLNCAASFRYAKCSFRVRLHKIVICITRLENAILQVQARFGGHNIIIFVKILPDMEFILL
jgi:hypothetical protein